MAVKITGLHLRMGTTYLNMIKLLSSYGKR